MATLKVYLPQNVILKKFHNTHTHTYRKKVGIKFYQILGGPVIEQSQGS